MTQTTLVIGASGRIGGLVADGLRERGHLVREGSRRGDPAFSWDDSRTWVDALAGIDAVYSSHPRTAEPGVAEHLAAFVEAAAAAGVTRIVHLTAHGAEGLPDEQAIIGSGLEWTFLRPSWFFQNFEGDLYKLRALVRHGDLAVPFSQARIGWVDVADIAAVAVAALTEPGHAGKGYEIMGPRLMTFHELAAEISEATGRTVTYTPVSVEEFERRITALGHEMAENEYFGMLDDETETLHDHVRVVLGREPRDFSAYARELAPTGVWDA